MMHWDDEKIRKGIFAVVEHIGEGRMPTAYEVREYYGDCKLIGAISTRGGFMTWADKLGLPMKNGYVMFGLSYELYTKKLLENKGFECVHTGTKFPYDLLVDGKVKIDVKVSHLVQFGEGSGYTFKISNGMPKCDLYIAHCMDKKRTGKVLKTYIIPAHVLTGMSQLTIGKNHSKYDAYLNKWNLIKMFSESLAKLEETS